MLGNAVPKLEELPSVPVPFGGGRSAVGPLTFAQLNILQWLGGPVEPPDAIICGVLDIPEGTRIQDVSEALAVLVSRHEGLRTTFVAGATPTQQVNGSGTLWLRVFAVDDVRPTDHPTGVGPAPTVNGASIRPVEVALQQRLRAEDPEPAATSLLRVAMATRDDRVVAVAFGCSHLVVDALAVGIVKREFAELVADPTARSRPAVRHQPLEQAAAEQSPAGRRKADATLRYWERHLAWLPQCLYAAPLVDGSCGVGESVAGEMTSPAASVALQHIAARTGASRPSIVLAALCAVLAQRTGYARLGIPVLSANRFERRLQDYVGTLAQTGLAVIEVAQVSFDQLVRRAMFGVVRASNHGMMDAVRHCELREGFEAQRGVNFVFEPLFNNILIDAPAGRPAAELAPIAWLEPLGAYTTMRWDEMPVSRAIARFDLYHVDRALVLRFWSGDTARVPAGEIESMLLAVERLLVAAARIDLDHDSQTVAIGLGPIQRDRDWLLVDSCWVELTETQRLLDAAFGPACSQIFAEVDGEFLVAYLAARSDVTTPEQAHQRCQAALPGRPTAMTPRRYVLFDSVPQQRGDASAWHGKITAGTGREPG